MLGLRPNFYAIKCLQCPRAQLSTSEKEDGKRFRCSEGKIQKKESPLERTSRSSTAAPGVHFRGDGAFQRGEGIRGFSTENFSELHHATFRFKLNRLPLLLGNSWHWLMTLVLLRRDDRVEREDNHCLSITNNQCYCGVCLLRCQRWRAIPQAPFPPLKHFRPRFGS